MEEKGFFGFGVFGERVTDGDLGHTPLFFLCVLAEEVGNYGVREALEFT